MPDFYETRHFTSATLCLKMMIVNCIIQTHFLLDTRFRTKSSKCAAQTPQFSVHSDKKIRWNIAAHNAKCQSWEVNGGTTIP